MGRLVLGRVSLVLVEDVHCRILLHVSYDCEEGDEGPRGRIDQDAHPIFSLVLVNPGTVQGIWPIRKFSFCLQTSTILGPEPPPFL